MSSPTLPVQQHVVQAVQSAGPTTKPKNLLMTVVKGLKTTVMGLILLLTLWLVYVFGSRALKRYFKTDEKVEPKAFANEDAVAYGPRLSQVNEVKSDKTVDALLSGSLGPAVVLFGAEWCGHCKNMEPAYEAAAKQSHVPFIRVDGASVPVSSNKFAVTGYPTVFGVSALGLLSRYGNARTVEGLLEFAGTLVPLQKAVVPGAAVGPSAQASQPVATAYVSQQPSSLAPVQQLESTLPVA